MSCVYLGVEVLSGWNSYKEVKQQIIKATRVPGYLKDIIWRNKYRSSKLEKQGEQARNKDIIKECGIGDVVRFARERRRRWNDHVQRAENSKLIRIARDQRRMGRRDLGRSLKRWKESCRSKYRE
ncbi:hypothetical protein Trydic_g537 [Trypoxylus dichotomus]